MRPALALLISIVIFGTVHQYIQFQNRHAPSQLAPLAEAPEDVQARFQLELTLTCDAEPEEFFALDPVSVLVRYRQLELVHRSEPLLAGTPLLIEDLPVANVDQHELWVEVQPASSFASVPTAARVRLLRDGIEQQVWTLWAPAGGPIRGKLSFEVSRVAPEKTSSTDGAK